MQGTRDTVDNIPGEASPRSYGKLLWAGILLGLGFGGFFDGIVFHQILQWHHMLTSAGFPPDSVANLQVNTLADGTFHAATYIFTAAGLILLWRVRPWPRTQGAGRYLIGAMLMGWGIFNLVEGIVDHQILGVLLWGLLMLLGGWWMTRRNRRTVNV